MWMLLEKDYHASLEIQTLAKIESKMKHQVWTTRMMSPHRSKQHSQCQTPQGRYDGAQQSLTGRHQLLRQHQQSQSLMLNPSQQPANPPTLLSALLQSVLG